MKRSGRVEVYQGRGAQPWRYRVVAANGEVTETSEGYATKSNAKRAARRFRLPLRDLTC